MGDSAARELAEAIDALKAFVQSHWEQSTKPNGALALSASERERLAELDRRVSALAQRFELEIRLIEKQSGPFYLPGTHVPMIPVSGGRMCYLSPDWLQSMDELRARALELCGREVKPAGDSRPTATVNLPDSLLAIEDSTLRRRAGAAWKACHELITAVGRGGFEAIERTEPKATELFTLVRPRCRRSARWD